MYILYDLSVCLFGTQLYCYIIVNFAIVFVLYCGDSIQYTFVTYIASPSHEHHARHVMSRMASLHKHPVLINIMLYYTYLTGGRVSIVIVNCSS